MVEIIREQLSSDFSNLLIGPWDCDEKLSGPPSSIYATGMLWPNTNWPETEGDFTTHDCEELNNPDEEDGTETGTTGKFAQKPSSIGMSFYCRGTEISIKPRAAVYFKVGTATQTEEPPEDCIWARKPLPEDPIELNLEKISQSKNITIPGFEVSFKIVVREKGHQIYLITVYMRNACDYDRSIKLCEEEVPDGNQGHIRYPCNDSDFCLFQSGFSVQAGEDTKLISMDTLADLAACDEQELSAHLLYRNKREFAVGHGISATWKNEDKVAEDEVTAISTAWIPASSVEIVDPQGHGMLHSHNDEFQSVLSAEFLGHCELGKLVSRLESFVKVYNGWINQKRFELSNEELSNELNHIAEKHLDTCLDCHNRLLDGIRFLETDQSAFLAFRHANIAMQRQLNFGEPEPETLIWRPFQLAFMLLCIRSISNPQSQHRDVMDLLWFPTGGGKTEAYLGLTAYTILYRRLTEEKSRTTSHVDVLMRYTLRLLTTQQFERAAAVICACEITRREFTQNAEFSFGSLPITIGLYVGGETTPNRIENTENPAAPSAAKLLHSLQAGEENSVSLCPLQRCPVCHNPINPFDNMRIENNKLKVFCTNPLCNEPHTRFGFYHDEKSSEIDNFLPVVTIDEELYESLPSLVISTVDKFAQLARKSEPGRLFGRDNQLPPNLIIQDELHLISGPLGSVVGVYEAVVDRICENSAGYRPKLVGSTATIARASDQVRLLFNRDVFQFPPSGIDASDSFFACIPKNPKTRLYLGTSCAGNSGKFMLQAATAVLMQLGLKYFEDEQIAEKIDPWWTVLAYFCSKRELAGGDNVYDDVVPISLGILAKRLGMSPRKLSTGIDKLELTSRTKSSDIPTFLSDLNKRLSGEADSMNECVNFTLATNMISVGMDIPRLGLMIMNGQPKSTAEYIQASSRVGRLGDGIVVTNLNTYRPRDLSYYEHFQAYHQTFYKNVEPSSVNPWAPNCIHRVLAAAIVACLRNCVTELKDRPHGLPKHKNEADVQLSKFLTIPFKAIYPDSAPSADSIVPEIIQEETLFLNLKNTSEEPVELDFQHFRSLAREALKFYEKWHTKACGDVKGETKYWYEKEPSQCLLGDAESGIFEQHVKPGTLPARAPNSMRSVETSSAFVDSIFQAENNYISSAGLVRKSQAISTFGIGSIIDLPGGSFMPEGLNIQYRRLCEISPKYASKNLEYRRIEAQRLSKFLGVPKILSCPTAMQPNWSHTKVHKDHFLPVTRFPRWYYSPTTEILKEYMPESPRNEIQEVYNKVKDVVAHLEHNGNKLVPARFIIAYIKKKTSGKISGVGQYEGCIGDFPWLEWCHLETLGENEFEVKFRKEECRYADLRLRSSKSSHSLSHLEVICNHCGSKRSMEKCFYLSGMTIKGYIPKLYRPWLSSESIYIDKGHLGHVMKSLSVIQRGGSSTWFPISFSTLDIPSELSSNLSEAINKVRTLVDNDLDEETAIRIQSEKYSLDENEIRKALEGNTDPKAAEYQCLSSTTKTADGNFECCVVPKLSERLSPYFNTISQVRRLRETRALSGFCRGDGASVEPKEIRDYLFNKRADAPFAQLSKNEPGWLPGYEMFGEGVFFRLNLERLMAWESNPDVIERTKSIHPEIEPGLLLLHSLSHLLIRAMALVCGYNCASLRERLYFSSDPAANQKQCGFLIYTASADSDGTLGGLMQLADNAHCERLLSKVLEYARFCGSDPICEETPLRIESETQSGSSCHSCLLLPETSCELFNRMLDRLMVGGSLDNPVLGYFNEQITG